MKIKRCQLTYIISDEAVEKQMKILVMEDNPADGKLLDIYLMEAFGNTYTASFAETLSEGLKQLESNHFDLIIVDLTLPDSSGLDTFNHVYEKSSGIPVIVLTGLEDETIGIKAVKIGAQDFLVKGKVKSKELKRSISYSIERNKLVKALSESTQKLEEKAYELSKEKENMAEAQRLAKCGSWEWDMIKNTFNWSDELYRIHGLLSHEFHPSFEGVMGLIHEQDRGYVRKMIDDSLKTLRTYGYYYRIICPDGVVKIVYAMSNILADKQGHPVYMKGTIQDVTDRRREEELENEKLRLEASLKVKEQFLANMSHEIRTPMNAIIGFTKLLMKENLSPENRQYVNAIKTSGDNLLVIINEILDFSKIESGKMIFDSIDFNLPQLSSALIEMMIPKAVEKGIKLTACIEDNVPENIIGDPTRLNQILVNLIGNAIKFTPKGEVALSVCLANEDKENVELEFSVTDTGIGISEENIPKIFESFMQASPETSRKYGGTGLGLTITKKMVEMQGGTITVNSKVNRGSCFMFRLQYKKSQVQFMNDPSLQPTVSNTDHQYIEGASILLVEDNILNQILAKKVLHNWKCKVDVADNGIMAVEKVEHNTYDVVLMDIQMPEMDGYEATRIIRNRLPNPKCNIPIIAMTAHAIIGEAEKCIQIGMDDYIPKPFDENALFDKITHFMSARA